jgi:hypothetical protein
VLRLSRCRPCARDVDPLEAGLTRRPHGRAREAIRGGQRLATDCRNPTRTAWPVGASRFRFIKRSVARRVPSTGRTRELPPVSAPDQTPFQPGDPGPVVSVVGTSAASSAAPQRLTRNGARVEPGPWSCHRRVRPLRPSSGPRAMTGSRFGSWLRTKRGETGISVVGLANRSSVSVQQIHNIEAGKVRRPRFDTRKKLMSALRSREP